jgi:hypothetical protein
MHLAGFSLFQGAEEVVRAALDYAAPNDIAETRV